ncbi:MAG: hypothetical protein IGS50_03500 [Synechococcales cyanobacterium C42_A2020_086]|jgi:hypothetical protein|nr:hypothetical protein [Synechococcales cyanobacterium M58_A2018_015]MBF2072818.1 hypothetical protein [Synechococcales cyanobacterium C42_A2020_086]
MPTEFSEALLVKQASLNVGISGLDESAEWIDESVIWGFLRQWRCLHAAKA